MYENSLLKEFIAATGLPEPLVEKTLTRLISDAKLNPQDVTLEHLRILVANYFLEFLISGPVAEKK